MLSGARAGPRTLRRPPSPRRRVGPAAVHVRRRLHALEAQLRRVPLPVLQRRRGVLVEVEDEALLEQAPPFRVPPPPGPRARNPGAGVDPLGPGGTQKGRARYAGASVRILAKAISSDRSPKPFPARGTVVGPCLHAASLCSWWS